MCKECGGASICEHGKVRSRCKVCRKDDEIVDATLYSDSFYTTDPVTGEQIEHWTPLVTNLVPSGNTEPGINIKLEVGITTTYSDGSKTSDVAAPFRLALVPTGNDEVSMKLEMDMSSM